MVLNFPTRKLTVRVQIQRLSYLTLSAKASSVPGSMQTATVGSLSDAKPRVEVPPAPSELNLIGPESTIDHENTDISAAVKLALASFPDDTARRIVVLSDGNENRGNLF